MKGIESNTITLKELLEISLGSSQMTIEHTTLLHCLIKILLQKLSCQEEVVNISGFQGQCLLEILKTAKDPPPFKLNSPIQIYIGEKFEKIKELEMRANELSNKIDDHFHLFLQLKMELDRLFRAEYWDRYAYPLEDLCSNYGRATALLCKSFALNSTFLLKLRVIATQPIVERMKTLEECTQYMTQTFRKLHEHIDNKFEHGDFPLALITQIAMLSRDVANNKNVFEGTITELQDMFRAKLDRIALPAMKTHLRNRFDDLTESLENMRKKPKKCLDVGPLPIEKDGCLSCGQYNSPKVLKKKAEIELCHEASSKQCALQSSEIRLNESMNAVRFTSGFVRASFFMTGTVPPVRRQSKIILIRGPFGRHAWTMQLRHLPRSKSGTKYHAVNPGRPIPMNEVPQRIEFDQKHFPEGVEKVTPCIADFSIPTFEQIRELYGNDSIKQLESMLENQTIHEKLAWAETDNNSDSLSHAQESVPPTVCHEFQAARLFLSHFGFLTFEERNPNSPAESLGAPPQRPLIVLDTKRTNFAMELNALDKLSARTYDTVHVFYVKAGQTAAEEIVGNMKDDNVRTLDPHFGNMLMTLGWPVDINEHSGWTGLVSTSWSLKNATSKTDDKPQQRSLNADFKFNGKTKVLYWADVSSEIAFVVPTEWNLHSELDGGCLSTSSGDALNVPNVWSRTPSDLTEGSKNASQRSRNLSLELDKSKDPIPPTRRKANAMKPSLLAQPPAKIYLVWLESFEDLLNFPIEELLPYTKTGEEVNILQLPRASDVHVIFVHALQSGVLRVKLQGPPGRMSFATPLVDGMVLSRRVVGNLARQTAHNMAKRRRLDNDNFQPPHVRRRLKVQDIVQKFKIDLSEPELLAHLFKTSI